MEMTGYVYAMAQDLKPKKYKNLKKVLFILKKVLTFNTAYDIIYLTNVERRVKNE